ncbi:hypothetical protein FDECE_580 [Fusarium decemcellulare]|nr:hypothetical protein FDECE_580 [Fusarium decemcellulare]
MFSGIFLVLIGAAAAAKPQAYTSPLHVENFISTGPSLDMVSSLIIGSEAAVIIDLPLAVPQALELADWVANTTDKPLVAAFSTHFHPDHYLSGAAFLEKFPETKFYANSKAVALMKNEAEQKVKQWKGILGDNSIVDKAAIPTPYDFTFFSLPGDEASPIYLLSPLVTDTIDATLFWIPSISTLIAGDSVYSRTVHLWLADLLSPALTESWLSTLDYVAHLKPHRIIPGHSLSLENFSATRDLQHSRKYVQFFKDQIEAKGPNFFTPQEIFNKFDTAFPGLLNSESQTSATLLNITSDQFGRGGTRVVHYVDLAAYDNAAVLEGWMLGSE